MHNGNNYNSLHMNGNKVVPICFGFALVCSIIDMTKPRSTLSVNQK